MSYNFVLYEAVMQALRDAIDEETQNLANDMVADFGGLKLRLGRIQGLKHAIEIAEATEQKIMER